MSFSQMAIKLDHSSLIKEVNDMEVMAFYRINIVDGYCKGWLITTVSMLWAFTDLADTISDKD